MQGDPLPQNFALNTNIALKQDAGAVQTRNFKLYDPCYLHFPRWPYYEANSADNREKSADSKEAYGSECFIATELQSFSFRTLP